MNNAPSTGNFQLDNECNACARVTSPLQGEGEGEGFQVQLRACSEPLTSILSPCIRGEERERTRKYIRARWNIPADDVKHRKEKPAKAFVV